MVLPDLPVIPGVVIDHVPGATGYAAATDGTIWSCLGLGPRFKNLQPWRMLAANHAQLARDYGVSTMMIYFIGTGKNWRAS